jgi:hypothetical protein
MTDTDSIIKLHFCNLNTGPGEFAVQYAQYGYIATHVDYAMADNRFLGSMFPAGVHIYGPYYTRWAGFVDLPCTADQLAAFENFLKQQLGKPYDMVDLLANFGIARNWRNPDKWWCSELLGAALETVKWFKNPLAMGVEKLSPRDLALTISANGVQVPF